MIENLDRAVKIAELGLSELTNHQLNEALFTGEYMYASDGYELCRLKVKTDGVYSATVEDMRANRLRRETNKNRELMFLDAIGEPAKVQYNLLFSSMLTCLLECPFANTGFLRANGSIQLSYDTRYHYRIVSIINALYRFNRTENNKLQLSFRNHQSGMEMLCVTGGDLEYYLMPTFNTDWTGE